MFAEEALSKTERKTTQTLEEALAMLNKGQVDALIADYPYCVVTAFRNKDKGFIAGKAPFTFEPMGVALPGEDVLLINWVENFLTGCQGTGLMKELQKHWFNPGPWMEELP
jgi:polar amino acid transport system substrate-binding protein